MKLRGHISGAVSQSPGFVADGLRRLLGSRDYQQKQAEIEAKIREKHAVELAAAAGYGQRRAIEADIQREIRTSRPSLYCLWIRS